MINNIVLERLVANIWSYAVALLFRLACYRDLHLPQKALKEIQFVADFFTLQIPQSNLGAWLRGFVYNRDHEKYQEDFLKNACGADLLVPPNLDPQSYVLHVSPRKWLRSASCGNRMDTDGNLLVKGAYE